MPVRIALPFTAFNALLAAAGTSSNCGVAAPTANANAPIKPITAFTFIFLAFLI